VLYLAFTRLYELLPAELQGRFHRQLSQAA
jgi:hypothetical protein